MSQVEFAAKLDVSQGAISNWEKGNDKPSSTMLFHLADITGDQSFTARETITDRAKPLPRAKPVDPKKTKLDVFREINKNLKRIADVLEEQYK